jgi:hydrogenase maturation protease
MLPRILIVAYGNPLRCDDGIAWRAADALEGKLPESQVEILRLHQLAPEVADSVRQRELVLFVDAACVDDVENTRAGEIRICEVSGGQTLERPGHFSHVYSPAKVLGFVRELYHETPRAFVITMAGENFDHGDNLSAPVTSALPELVTKIQRLIEDVRKKASTTKDTKVREDL